MMEIAIQELGLPAEAVKIPEGSSPQGEGSFAGVLAQELAAAGKGSDPKEVREGRVADPYRPALPPDFPAEQAPQAILLIPAQTDSLPEMVPSLFQGSVTFHIPQQGESENAAPASLETEDRQKTSDEGIPLPSIIVAASGMPGVPFPNETIREAAPDSFSPSAAAPSCGSETLPKDMEIKGARNSNSPAAVNFTAHNPVSQGSFQNIEAEPNTAASAEADHVMAGARLDSKRDAQIEDKADLPQATSSNRSASTPGDLKDIRPPAQPGNAAPFAEISPERREGILSPQPQVSSPEASATPRPAPKSEYIGIRGPENPGVETREIPRNGTEALPPPAAAAAARENSWLWTGMESRSDNPGRGQEWGAERPPLPKTDHAPSRLKTEGIGISGFYNLTADSAMNRSDAGGISGAADQSAPFLTEAEAPDLYRQVGEKVIWSLKNNQEKIRVVLDPPELGSIYLEIHREKEGITTTLWAENALTKSTLESSQIQIQKIVENEGFHLEKFNVFIQQEGRSFGEERRGPVYRQALDERRENISAVEGFSPSAAAEGNRRSGNNSLDVFV